jgi:hypothetical protein
MAAAAAGITRRVSELVRSHIGNVVPRMGLRVRVPCPPLMEIFTRSRLRET